MASQNQSNSSSSRPAADTPVQNPQPVIVPAKSADNLPDFAPEVRQYAMLGAQGPEDPKDPEEKRTCIRELVGLQNDEIPRSDSDSYGLSDISSSDCASLRQSLSPNLTPVLSHCNDPELLIRLTQQVKIDTLSQELVPVGGEKYPEKDNTELWFSSYVLGVHAVDRPEYLSLDSQNPKEVSCLKKIESAYQQPRSQDTHFFTINYGTKNQDKSPPYFATVEELSLPDHVSWSGLIQQIKNWPDGQSFVNGSYQVALIRGIGTSKKTIAFAPISHMIAIAAPWLDENPSPEEIEHFFLATYSAFIIAKKNSNDSKPKIKIYIDAKSASASILKGTQIQKINFPLAIAVQIIAARAANIEELAYDLPRLKHNTLKTAKQKVQTTDNHLLAAQEIHAPTEVRVSEYLDTLTHQPDSVDFK